jgi:hypothetical protein
MLALLVSRGRAEEKARASRWRRLLAELEDLARGAAKEVDQDRLCLRRVLLGAPAADGPEAAQAARAAAAQRQEEEEALARVAEEIDAGREAVAELCAALRADGNDQRRRSPPRRSPPPWPRLPRNRPARRGPRARPRSPGRRLARSRRAPSPSAASAR